MFARLTTKAKQREKEKRASDQRPAKQLEVEGRHMIIPPNKACDLLDVVAMHASPALPRYETHLRNDHDVIRAQWNGPEYLDDGNSHQAEIQATIGTGDELQLFLSALV